MGKFYSKEEIEFLKVNAEKFGVKVCAKLLNRPLEGLRTKINKLGLKVTNKCAATEDEVKQLQFKSSFIPLTIDFNESKTPNELAYFLGFLWADGYICIKDKSIRIEIQEEDGIELQHIFEKIASFSIYKRSRKNRKPQMTFYYKDEKIIDTLISLGKYPKSEESHEKILTYIPEKYHIWFLRGLIDGDGCFYIHDYSYYICHQFSIAASFNFDWSFLQALLNNMGLSCNISKSVTEHGNSSKLRATNSKEIKDFISKLYNIKDNIWLSRKYNKAITF